MMNEQHSPIPPTCDICNKPSYGLVISENGNKICPICRKNGIVEKANAETFSLSSEITEPPVIGRATVNVDMLELRSEPRNDAPIVAILKKDPPIEKVRTAVAQLNVREAPNSDATVVDVVGRGTIFEISEEQMAINGSYWLRVQGENKWINRAFVEVI